MKNNKIKTAALAGTMALAVMFSGCNLSLKNEERFQLPDNPVSFEMNDIDSSSLNTIEVNDRTYMPYGSLKGELKYVAIQDCLGYLDGDKNLRVYTLNDDPYDNYLMVVNVDRMNETPDIWRDFSTYSEDIFTPKIVEPAGYEEWGSSDLHYEMEAVQFVVTVDADDVKVITMNYYSGDHIIGTSGSGRADEKVITKGDKMYYEIPEISADKLAPDGGSFEIRCEFTLQAENNDTYTVEGSFERSVKLGDTFYLTLTGNQDDGYKFS